MLLGQFNHVCQTMSLPLCPLVGPIQERAYSTCIARNLDVGGYLIFNPGTLAVYILVMIITGFIIYCTRTKYTAVGREEMLCFFYVYLITVFVEFLLTSGFISVTTSAYPWFVGVQLGLISGTIWCLLLTGFVGFQFAEDGTALSLWSIRASTCLISLIVLLFSIGTFKDWTPWLSSERPVLLWVIYYVLNGAALALYVLLQVLLILKTLSDRWPLGVIFLSTVSFIAGQVLFNYFGPDVCELLSHYTDSLFFTILATLFSVMMIYKYWDSLTNDDLEYSLDYQPGVWDHEVKGGVITWEGERLLKW
ncbi:Chitin synthase, class 7 [Basidiobolus ranarum]|uniref:Chitin synthase export chaperone n=1 Tax=Basidiobolus ranarum TaxID=34480 RepID=A0ABR2VV36_9FUNG